MGISWGRGAHPNVISWVVLIFKFFHSFCCQLNEIDCLSLMQKCNLWVILEKNSVTSNLFHFSILFILLCLKIQSFPPTRFHAIISFPLLGLFSCSIHEVARKHWPRPSPGTSTKEIDYKADNTLKKLRDTNMTRIDKADRNSGQLFRPSWGSSAVYSEDM